MNKQRARQLYELADRLSKLDVNTLSEQQRQQRSTMIAKLQEEVKTIKEFAPDAGPALAHQCRRSLPPREFCHAARDCWPGAACARFHASSASRTCRTRVSACHPWVARAMSGRTIDSIGGHSSAMFQALTTRSAA